MELTHSVDFRQAAKDFGEIAPRQVNFAMAKTLTALAKDAKDEIIAQMPVAFKGPTLFTLRAPAFDMATPKTQESRIYLKKSQEDMGKSLNEHLLPGVQGTPSRHQKKIEVLLMRTGFLPPGWVTTPGKAMPVDTNGNIPGSVYKQIINILQIKKGTPFATGKSIYEKSQKRARKLGVQVEMFCIAPGKNTAAKGGGWLPPGVYRHLPGHKLLQMLKFVRKASYDKRLDMPKIIADTIAAKGNQRWQESCDFALSRAAP